MLFVRCELKKQKWPRVHHHRVEADILGDDEFGTWLFSSRANVATRHDGTSAALGHDVLTLLPHEAWWVAAWVFESSGELNKLWVDVATPVRWIDGNAEYVDLQIDIERVGGREPDLLDMQEFEEKVLSTPYPPSVAAAARQAAAFVIEHARSYANPFGDAYKTWKARAGVNG
jgi:protein associated with RNAse G/E